MPNEKPKARSRSSGFFNIWRPFSIQDRPKLET
jgi:hypothetical protein